MGQLLSRNYINSNFTLRSGGTPSTDAYLIANCAWIETNYLCQVSPYGNDDRCPDASELTALVLSYFQNSASEFTFTSLTCTFSTSVVSHLGAISANSYAAIILKVNVIRLSDNAIVETTEFYNGAYTANTQIYSQSIQVYATTPIPPYGYRVEMVAEEPY